MIYLSAGHHNADSGAVGNGYKEADLTKEFRNAIVKELDKMGVKYILDKDSETNSQYQGRIKPGSGSVLLDIHFNSATSNASGVEVLIANDANGDSRLFASEILKATISETALPNRGVKKESDSQHARIGILHRGAGIAALVEVGFISNANDIKAYKKALPELAKSYAKILKQFEDLRV